ncbi:MAG TPA: hypothetical protein VKY85_07745 [Candidatus Angelobacter sp.]|nr:hypothetical protein [Candidatus Angelobacter sp.]
MIPNQPQRLFESATLQEWQKAEAAKHLDIWQALNYLKSGEEEIVKIRFTDVSTEVKRKTIKTYSRRLGLSVQTRCLPGTILIRNVTVQRKRSGQKRGKLRRDHIVTFEGMGE